MIEVPLNDVKGTSIMKGYSGTRRYAPSDALVAIDA